jgi:hypothetical protein
MSRDRARMGVAGVLIILMTVAVFVLSIVFAVVYVS